MGIGRDNPELCCASHSEHLTTVNCYFKGIGMKYHHDMKKSIYSAVGVSLSEIPVEKLKKYSWYSVKEEEQIKSKKK